MGPVLSLYARPPSPAPAPSLAVAVEGEGLPGVIKNQTGERSSSTQGGKRRELVFFGSEMMATGPKRQTMLGMKEDRGFSRCNIVGMKERESIVCVFVRTVEGGNGIRGNTFGRAGRAT